MRQDTSSIEWTYPWSTLRCVACEWFGWYLTMNLSKYRKTTPVNLKLMSPFWNYNKFFMLSKTV
jgi:hypothetical protein